MEQTELRARTAVRPVTPRQRAARAARNGGEPTLEFVDRVPYDAYVHASTLHRLQQPLSDDPGEMSFLMVSQIMELYFGLTCHELRDTSRLLRADRVWEALAPLRRAALHLEALNAAWRGLRWMTPADFNRFRNLLGEGSGFQSAMYRHLEFLLGLRDPALIRPFRRQTEVYAELTAALATPSVWDEVIALLARHGHDLPAELLERDVATEHEVAPRRRGGLGAGLRRRRPGQPPAAARRGVDRGGRAVRRLAAPPHQGGAAHHGRQGRQRRLGRAGVVAAQHGPGGLPRAVVGPDGDVRRAEMTTSRTGTESPRLGEAEARHLDDADPGHRHLFHVPPGRRRALPRCRVPGR